MKRYYPDGSTDDSVNVAGYVEAELLIEVLRRCGIALTRENVMTQAVGLRNLTLPMMLPGITVTASPEDYNLFGRFQLIRFDGATWVPSGEPLGG